MTTTFKTMLLCAVTYTFNLIKLETSSNVDKLIYLPTALDLLS